LLNKDASILDDFDELVANWKNIKLFFKELIFYVKDKILKELKTEKWEMSKNIWEYLKVIEILDETYTKTKNSLDENTTFIIGILKVIEK
jgi:hypothetical protein